MRPSFRAALLFTICIGCTPGAVIDGPAPVAAPKGTLLQTCMWSWGSDGATESSYVVDLDRKKMVSQVDRRTPSKKTPECAHRRVERKKHDLQTYNRLLERFSNRTTPGEHHKELAAMLEWIERSTKWGASRANAFEASPDGRYGIFSTTSRPILLIDVETLRTRVLVKGHSYLDTPIAWAPDSRVFALAAPESDEISIFRAEDAAVVAKKRTYGSRIGTLAWSSDMQQIAAFGFQNRRMNKSPLGLLFAAAGHPEFRNDGVIEIYILMDENRWSLPLAFGITEMSSPSVEIEWK